VIDFGIAKATNQRLTEKTLFTAFGQFIGTPAYMSPEQAALSNVEVDRRSDVYSLGVLLYELLTGTTPLETEALRAAAFVEMLRVIREVDPPTPSDRLQTLGDRLTEIASRRRVEIPELAGQPLLVYERRSSTYRLVERALLEASIFPRIVMELDHLGAVASMVRAGLGLAIVPRWAVADDLAAGRLAGLTIGKTGLARAWGLGLRAEDHQPQTLRAFVRLCLERLPALLTV